MADTAVPLSSLTLNASTADPAGTAIVHANTHVITPTGPWSKLAIRFVNTTASEKIVTVTVGDNPPAQSAGQGTITSTLAAGDSTPTAAWVVLESARFAQDNGTIRITVASSMTGSITAFKLP